jgi:hypothetical protein
MSTTVQSAGPCPRGAFVFRPLTAYRDCNSARISRRGPPTTSTGTP